MNTDEIQHCAYCDVAIFEYDIDEWLDCQDNAVCRTIVGRTTHQPLDND